MPTTAGPTVTRPSELPWQNGLEVLATMAPAWRDNLGPRERVDSLMARYNQKTLYRDPETTRRLDLVRVDPGYADLTNAFHDTVEECFVLDGEFDLDGEGHFVAGDYFWRPAGYVHAARSTTGFFALLGLQGADPDEASGPASRHVRPDDEAGTNVLHPDDPERAVGPRGWVRCQPTGHLPWVPCAALPSDRLAPLGIDLDAASVRVLSRNEPTGGQTVQVRLPAGAAAATRNEHGASSQWVVLSGSLAIGPHRLGREDHVAIPVGTPVDAWHSPEGCVLYGKIDGWRTPTA